MTKKTRLQYIGNLIKLNTILMLRDLQNLDDAELEQYHQENYDESILTNEERKVHLEFVK